MTGLELFLLIFGAGYVTNVIMFRLLFAAGGELSSYPEDGFNKILNEEWIKATREEALMRFRPEDRLSESEKNDFRIIEFRIPIQGDHFLTRNGMLGYSMLNRMEDDFDGGKRWILELIHRCTECKQEIKR